MRKHFSLYFAAIVLNSSFRSISKVFVQVRIKYNKISTYNNLQKKNWVLRRLRIRSFIFTSIISRNLLLIIKLCKFTQYMRLFCKRNEPYMVTKNSRPCHKQKYFYFIHIHISHYMHTYKQITSTLNTFPVRVQLTKIFINADAGALLGCMRILNKYDGCVSVSSKNRVRPVHCIC